MISVLEYENRNKLVQLKHLEDDDWSKEMDMFFYGKKMPQEFHCQIASSPWMNRIFLDNKYAILPKNINYNDDIEIATSSNFIVLKFENAKASTLEEADVKHFNQLLSEAITPAEKIRFKEKRASSRYYGMMFQLYRMIYSSLPDSVIEKLRITLQESPEKAREWAEALNAANRSIACGSLDMAVKDLDALLTREDCAEVPECFFSSLLSVEMSESILSTSALYPKNGNLSLSFALSDPKLTEQLIRALDPESIRLYRSFR